MRSMIYWTVIIILVLGLCVVRVICLHREITDYMDARRAYSATFMENDGMTKENIANVFTLIQE